MSASFFDVLGTRAALGRGFVAADDERSSPSVAVLSVEAWRTQFGADPRDEGFDAPEERDLGILYVVGRLAPGVDRASARAEMDGIVGLLARPPRRVG